MEIAFMNSSMVVRPTSTSPRCDPGPRLTGSAVSRASVTHAERDEMYGLLQTYFCGTERERFEADLREKQSVILLRDTDSGRLRGFSTLMTITASIDGKEVVAFFSGDTIVDRDYWGERALSRLWAQTVFEEAERVLGQRPAVAVYWFLICSGYKTWRFLPVFFRTFYPNADGPTPPHAQRILDALGARKFGDQYLPASGIVRLRTATPLRPGIANVTAGRLRDPNVAFFARMNPGHVRGDELACLAELSRANLTRAGQRIMAHPL
jgi:hypothetical protein